MNAALQHGGAAPPTWTISSPAQPNMTDALPVARLLVA